MMLMTKMISIAAFVVGAMTTSFAADHAVSGLSQPVEATQTGGGGTGLRAFKPFDVFDANGVRAGRVFDPYGMQIELFVNGAGYLVRLANQLLPDGNLSVTAMDYDGPYVQFAYVSSNLARRTILAL